MYGYFLLLYSWVTIVLKKRTVKSGLIFTTMTFEQEDHDCLFCLEPRKGIGRRQKQSIQFKGLFSCQCIFYSHSQCIIEWQIHCLNELQCPICRTHIIHNDPDENRIVLYQHQHQPLHRESYDEIAKKFLLFITLNLFFVLFVFSIAFIHY